MFAEFGGNFLFYTVAIMSLVSGTSYLIFTAAINKVSPKKYYQQKTISEEKHCEVSYTFHKL